MSAHDYAGRWFEMPSSQRDEKDLIKLFEDAIAGERHRCIMAVTEAWQTGDLGAVVNAIRQEGFYKKS